MREDKYVKDTITIMGEEIPIKSGFISQKSLKFYPENPRLYSIIYSDVKKPSQEEIEEKLIQMEHVKVLIQSIKANKGLIEAIIVRDGDYVVLEGNSRLAAYRALASKDPITWDKMRCKIVPKNLSDEMVFALLGEYHIVGRKDWLPYEQAGYLYRCHKEQHTPVEVIGKELGLSESEINKLIEVYRFMLHHKDNNINHWSYYEEYLRSRPIKGVREEQPSFDKLIVEKIRNGDIPKAIDIRHKLGCIAKHGKKVLKDFISGKVSFEESYKRAEEGGAGNVIFERLNRFRQHIADPDIEEEIKEFDKNLIDKCLFELNRIKHRVDQLISKLKSS